VILTFVNHTVTSATVAADSVSISYFVVTCSCQGIAELGSYRILSQTLYLLFDFIVRRVQAEGIFKIACSLLELVGMIIPKTKV